MPNPNRRMPTLRPQPVGDVHLRHDLDSRNERNAHRLGQQHRVAKQSVDAIAHCDTIFLRLEMNIAGSLLDSRRDDSIYETHYRLARNADACHAMMMHSRVELSVS